MPDSSQDQEARAFDFRIEERIAAGFVPDLRRAVKCDYFYKSFWRDPHYVDLYIGSIVRTYLELLGRYCPPGASIIDVGCGAGYVSLELARNGYYVDAIDISESCIREAQRMLDENPYRNGFGSLNYQVASFDDVAGEYDVALFSGSLHHMNNIEQTITHAATLLRSGGHLLCYEPCHERWQKKDAALVALIRGLLAITGHWFSHEADHLLRDERGLERLTQEIHDEYVLERDKDEPEGQSPQDNTWNGEEILGALRRRFLELEIRPGFSFIYRLLGGMRGDDERIHTIADLLTAYDRFSVANGYVNPNGFCFIGRKAETSMRDDCLTSP